MGSPSYSIVGATSIESGEPATVRVSDDTLTNAIVLAHFANGEYEVVYDGDNFAPRYSGSVVSKYSSGGSVVWDFTLYRVGGWPSAPSIKIVAVESDSGTMDLTLTKAISSGTTWTETDTGHTLSTSKTSRIEAWWIIKRASGESAYFHREIAVQYVSGSFGIVGQSATTVSGMVLADEVSQAGFDARFKLSAGVVTFEAIAPASGSFSVTYRVTEL